MTSIYNLKQSILRSTLEIKDLRDRGECIRLRRKKNASLKIMEIQLCDLEIKLCGFYLLSHDKLAKLTNHHRYDDSDILYTSLKLYGLTLDTLNQYDNVICKPGCVIAPNLTFQDVKFMIKLKNAIAKRNRVYKSYQFLNNLIMCD